jgi:cbb3-type cytochrome oxidase subunit 3
VARDWSAIGSAPVVTLIAVWLICILAYAAWPADTAEQRLHYLGWLAILTVLLLAYCVFFYQRRTINARVETRLGSIDLDDVTNGQSVTVAATAAPAAAPDAGPAPDPAAKP